MDIEEIFYINSPIQSSKIAGFDLDDTLIQTKSGAKFPISEHDWKWKYDNVVSKIEEYKNKGYECIIFTNQFRLKNITKNKIIHLSKLLNIGVVVSKKKDDYRKPNIAMWELIRNTHENIDYENSFYCGDACGREGDFSDSDLQFANNIGIQFYTPEDIFLL